MPQGWDFEVLGVPRGQFFFKHGHVAYQINGDDVRRAEQNASKIFYPSVNMVALVEAKRSNII